jgi:hypothetical protein
VRWTTPLGANEATLLPAVLTAGHFLVGAFVEDPKAVKYSYTAWLLDKGGRVVQNMNSKTSKPDGFERPPAFLGAAHDRLVISVESRVEVYR